MKEPTEFQKVLVDKATYLRGRILTSYAQVEFLLADISVKLDLHFPYPVKERIKAAKRIAERAGYERYRDELIEVCDKLLEFEELRHLMAHGFLIVHVGLQETHKFEYRLYQRNGKDDFQLLTYEMALDHLSYNVDSITGYVTKAIDLFKRIYLEQRLEDPEEGALTQPK